MDTDFQFRRQSEFPDGMADHHQVFLKLKFKLSGIAHVVDPLVEPAREFRSYCLHRNLFFSQHKENKEQFHGSLGCGNFIHRHFGNEIAGTF